MVLDYFFDKNLVFCLEADNQEQLFDQVASLLEEREIVTPTYREALITREKSFPTGLDMEFLGKDLPNVAIPHTDIVHNLAEKVVVVRLEKPVTFHNMIAPGKEVEVSLLFFIINNSSSSQTNILDFILPVYKGELEKGYQFDGWEISGFEGKKDAGYVINLSKDTFIKPVFKKIEEKKEEENKPTFDVSKKKDNPQVNHSQLNESHRKEDLQREDHSQKSDSTKDVTATVLDKNNISSKSTTNNPNKLPKTGTASGAQTLLAAGIMFIVGIFLGLKKKNQD
ncbi:serine protease [Streptococcus pneumoniae]|nr:serine protease [Streptococcus pneumoniae]